MGAAKAFIFDTCDPNDIFDLFEDGWTEGELDIIRVTETWTIEDCVIHIKKFPSKTQARKNGWGGEIPHGYKEWKCGKQIFFTLRPLSIEQELQLIDWDVEELINLEFNPERVF